MTRRSGLDKVSVALKFVAEREEFLREYLLNGFREIVPFTVSRYTSSLFFLKPGVPGRDEERRLVKAPYI